MAAKPKNTAAVTRPMIDGVAIAATNHYFPVIWLECSVLRALVLLICVCEADVAIGLLEVEAAMSNFFRVNILDRRWRLPPWEGQYLEI